MLIAVVSLIVGAIAGVVLGGGLLGGAMRGAGAGTALSAGICATVKVTQAELVDQVLNRAATDLSEVSGVDPSEHIAGSAAASDTALARLRDSKSS